MPHHSLSMTLCLNYRCPGIDETPPKEATLPALFRTLVHRPLLILAQLPLTLYRYIFLGLSFSFQFSYINCL